MMTLDVAHAEHAGGGPGHARVRLVGRARGAAATAPPTLLIADGARWRRFAAEPGTPLLAGGDAPFAVAFEIPLHLAVGDGAWFLEPGPPVGGAAVPRERLDALTARVAALGEELAAVRATVTAERDTRGELAALRAMLVNAGLLPDPAATRDAHAARAAAPPVAAATPISRGARRRLRALRGPGLPAILVAAGALAIGDAVATVTWQEPVSALWAAHEQHALDGDLSRLDASYASPRAADAAGASAATVTTPQQRMRALAAHLDARTRAGKPLGRIDIARLHARYVIVQGTRAASLAKGPGHYAGTALPGEAGTTGIAGHRTTYGAPFRHLDALRRGDAITVTMPYGRFVYRVEGTRIVKPEDVSALQAIGRQRLVLTACHPLYSAAQRLVVLASLDRATPRGAAAPGTTA